MVNERVDTQSGLGPLMFCRRYGWFFSKNGLAWDKHVSKMLLVSLSERNMAPMTLSVLASCSAIFAENVTHHEWLIPKSRNVFSPIAV